MRTIKVGSSFWEKIMYFHWCRWRLPDYFGKTRPIRPTMRPHVDEMIAWWRDCLRLFLALAWQTDGLIDQWTDRPSWGCEDAYKTLFIIIWTNLKPNFWLLILTILPLWIPKIFLRSGKRISRPFLWAYLQLPIFLCLGDIQRKSQRLQLVFCSHICFYWLLWNRTLVFVRI